MEKTPTGTTLVTYKNVAECKDFDEVIYQGEVYPYTKSESNN